MDDPASNYWIFHISIIFISLIFSAFFSGMEIAFLSASKLKIELDKKKGLLSGKLISRFADNPKMFIASMLVGNNIALVSYGYFAGEALIKFATIVFDKYQYFWLAWFVPEFSPWISLLVQTISTTLLVLFGAEFIPKAIFKNQANVWLRRFSLILSGLYFVLLPFAYIVTGISNWLIKLMIPESEIDEQVKFGTIDLDDFLSDLEDNLENKDLDNEIQILKNALEFSKVKARECMVPRNEVVGVELNTPIEDVANICVETGFSKVVVYRDNIDNIIGYVHSRELFSKPKSVKNILLNIDIVPEAMLVVDVLGRLIHQKKNMIIVLDEFGGTAGILTLEDIVEEIFGEFEDEHDSENLREEQINETTYVFSARQEIDYLNDNYDLNLPDVDDFDTLNGLVVFHLGDIPIEGEELILDNLKFTVMKVAETHVEEVKIEVIIPLGASDE